ncbi:CDP-6-deoxy-delta-3,4-glucoseen reductase [Acidocella aquatica]|uniref:CDP-6-deoxy-delta-3,4-glucoseen reductase n=1 Tax=Acidocella aquatica TaxID=1922313 RepID=A0ABQ6A323_9PROT|nr:2Fe-2S iron-sulfur cluster binding domain-containing protein [Acidocella aquatica]GLR66861.1 CDP-6-deoxy-delta-3,4-glucoseen reductase [Acidocella aquatica]
MSGFFKKLFSGSAPHVAHVNPWGAEFPVSSSQTLLEAALAQNIPFPHNCTVGTCGSCKCRLTEGKVSAITDFGYTLSREELAAGYILACQARLKSPITVKVETAGDNLPEPETYTGQITRQEPLTHDILALTVEIDRAMPYVAGQYASLNLPALAGRSYSFATAPERGGRRELTFYIRKVPGGAFTDKLFTGALQNTTFELTGPHGHFFLRGGEGPIICMAGGSGLAPLLSLLHDARKNRLRRRCVLLFGARTQADLYALDQIEEIKNTWQDEFTFLPVLSDEPADSGWTGRRGFFTGMLPEFIPAAQATATQAYMCGPPPMIDAAVTALTALGLPLEAIHYDKFTDSSHAAK